MFALIICGWVVAIVFFSLSFFLGKELLKKFKYLKMFNENDGYVQKLIYHYPGGKKGRMSNIFLAGKEPFEVIISFELEIPILNYSGVDWYGFVRSEKMLDGRHMIMLSTWMAKKPVNFSLIVKSERKNEFFFVEAPKGNFPPRITCPPHFYQRLGFYA